MVLMSMIKRIRDFVIKIPKKEGRYLIPRLLKKYAKGKVLNMGCGDIDYFKEFDNVINLDIVPKKFKNFQCWDLNKLPLPFRNNEFDTIFASHIIEHLEAPYLVLRECRRILKSGGILIIGLPNPHYISDAQLKKDYHINLICDTTMKSILEKIDFKIISKYHNWLIIDNFIFGYLYSKLPRYFKTDYWYVCKK